jgi:integrase/recombinase XerD
MSFLFIVKYEPYIRNKAALTLFWDLDARNARNHEVTLLKIKHIHLKERYGEGEIPHEAKTGTGPMLLTCSFPYVRDWLNDHPFKNEPEARPICNLITGRAVNPEAMWTMMKQLRNRIVRLLENGTIDDNEERQTLEYLLKAKKWNPYCILHSAITCDSDILPEYALRKYTFAQQVTHLESNKHNRKEFVDIAVRASIFLYRHASAHAYEKIEGS